MILHFPCYLHGGQGKESNRIRFSESRLKLREAAHRCASLGPRIEECTGANKKLLKLRAKVALLDVCP